MQRVRAVQKLLAAGRNADAAAVERGGGGGGGGLGG